MKTYHFKAIRAKQALGHAVFCFAADPADVLAFSRMDRIERQSDGTLKGFQRHPLASHIKEIREYLVRDDALLPNAVILGFLGDVTIKELGDGIVDIVVNHQEGGSHPAFVIDGQQRLMALSGVRKPGFQVLVSAFLCKNDDELRRQFVLTNNTRPLPKALVYELLPRVDGLPERFTSRKFAFAVVEQLNFRRDSVLHGQIRQHTNPKGALSDIAILRIVMNSASDGAIWNLLAECTSASMPELVQAAFELLNNYFLAVEGVFQDEWQGRNPHTSRLRHGAGLVAMGFIMDYLCSVDMPSASNTYQKFYFGLTTLKPFTAWTCGSWQFDGGVSVPWNGIHNTPADINMLTDHLMRSLRRCLRSSLSVAA